MGSHLHPSHKVQWDRGRRVWEKRARNPICLWRSPSASFPSFPIHTLLSSSSVSWQFSCPSLSWCQAHAHCLQHSCSGPCCLGSGVPASPGRGAHGCPGWLQHSPLCSVLLCRIWLSLKNYYSKKAQAGTKLSMTRTIRVSPVNWG